MIDIVVENGKYKIDEHELIATFVNGTLGKVNGRLLCSGKLLDNGRPWADQVRVDVCTISVVLVDRILPVQCISTLPCPYQIAKTFLSYLTGSSKPSPTRPCITYGLCRTCQSSVKCNYAVFECFACSSKQVTSSSYCYKCRAYVKSGKVVSCPTCLTPMLLLEQIQSPEDSVFSFDPVCCICYESVELVVAYLTAHERVCHVLCLACFAMYARSTVTPAGLLSVGGGGVILPCPLHPQCDAIHPKWDCHILRLADDATYRRYQAIAAEQTLKLQLNGQICPLPTCGAMFESDIGYLGGTAVCPHCSHRFCVKCFESAHLGVDSCGSSDDASVKAIADLKRCPGCRTPTERNEGCNHMTCARCRMEWCFECQKQWDFDCMRDHWVRAPSYQ